MPDTEVLPAHAKFSPSSAHRWANCTAAMIVEEQYPDDSSDSADEGTAAHELAAMVLATRSRNCQAFLGRVIEVKDNEGRVRRSYTVDTEMCDEVQKYVDRVTEIEKSGATLCVEQKVDFSSSIGLSGKKYWSEDPRTGEKILVDSTAYGTSDCILIGSGILHVGDLKYGANPRNIVHAEKNEQMMCYALGALEAYEDIAGPFEKIRLSIYQPRCDWFDTWETTPEELRAFAAELQNATDRILHLRHVNPEKLTEAKLEANMSPGEKTCKWCKHKPVCPAKRKQLEEGAGVYFDNLDDIVATTEAVQGKTTEVIGDNRLSQMMAHADQLDDLLKAVRAEVERRLLAGTPVTGWKLVEGRRGARKWSDEKAAETLLKEKFRLTVDEMYDKTVISAVQAVKLLKDQPKRLAQVEALISQSNGKPSVAPADDKRPEWKPATFEDLDAESLA